MNRPPVVTILGHVDHGKTSLLDYIRQSDIAGREHGGITQKIGGYEAHTGIKGYPTDKITFIDTPGHEAFAFLRARGANVADIAILIIDAKDSLMPQTIESISHIKNAKLPFIVALNKIDLPEANPDRVKRDLLKYDVQVEDQGGKVICLPVSAKNGKGVKEMLEAILLLAADLNLQYEKNNPPLAFIIETKKDRRGVVASVILKDGALKVGDEIYAGDKKAKIKNMISDRGENIREALPSMPVELLGFSELPQTGSRLSLKSEPAAEVKQTLEESKTPAFTVESILNTTAPEKKLSLIIKSDSQGSLEAITASLVKNPQVELILQGVGDIHKSDVFLAKTSGAIIIGFNARVEGEIRDLAKQEKVIIKTYSIIYELLDELNEVADLMKEKEEKQRNLKGEAKILANFIIENEKVCGVKVTKGKLNLGDQVEFYRGANLIGKSRLVSLQIRAKKVAEIKKEQEGGMIFSPPLDFRVGDVIKSIL